MKTKPKSSRVMHLVRLLDERDNDRDAESPRYLRHLRRLGKTGKPSAAPVIAGFLHIPGIVGRRAAFALVRLGRSSSMCRVVVLRICEERLETSLDSNEIRNALRVYELLGGPYTMLNAA